MIFVFLLMKYLLVPFFLLNKSLDNVSLQFLESSGGLVCHPASVWNLGLEPSWGFQTHSCTGSQAPCHQTHLTSFLSHGPYHEVWVEQ